MVDVQIIGAGAAELAAAVELAEVGLSIRISPAPGDDAAWAALPAAGVADPDSALREFLTHVAAPLAEGGPATPAAEPLCAPLAPVLLRAPSGAWAPQPTPEVLGIPAVPVSADALVILGGGASARAYLDRVKPLLTIGKTHSLGELVRSRMGKAALARLVEPIVRERFGVAAEGVDMAIAAPGLNEDLTVIGTLSGAVLAYAERDAARETRVRPSGGWLALREALLVRLGLYTVEFADAPVAEAHSSVDGWAIRDADGVETTVGALVIGVDPFAAAAPGLASELADLAPRFARLRVSVAIEDPELPETEPPRDALQLADADASDGPWTVRLGSDSRGGWVAEALSPAGIAPPSSPDAAQASAAELAEAIAAIGSAGARPAGGAVTAIREVAPYATVELRDADRSRLSVWRAARDETLPVGPALHGGDLAAAIADARSSAVVLRRRLTGIAD